MERFIYQVGERQRNLEGNFDALVEEYRWVLGRVHELYLTAIAHDRQLLHIQRSELENFRLSAQAFSGHVDWALRALDEHTDVQFQADRTDLEVQVWNFMTLQDWSAGQISSVQSDFARVDKVTKSSRKSLETPRNS